MTEKAKKAVVIGSGLGGLLTAAQLAKDGWSVDVYERLSLIGGRFANIEYNGYQLSTGALHMVPHGTKGPLATMLRELGADFEIIQSSPMAIVRMPKNSGETDYKNGYEDTSHVDFKKHLTSKNKLMMVLLTLSFNAGLIRPGKVGFKTWYSKYIHDDRIDRCADSFTGWALSTTADEVTTREVFKIFRNVYKYGGPGILVGGCQTVIDELVRIISSNGGTVYTDMEVTRIIIQDGKATGVIAGGKVIAADLVISDIGHKEAWEICEIDGVECGGASQVSGFSNPAFKEYEEKLAGMKPSAGLKICFASDEQILPDGCSLMLTPYTRRINGLNEVTIADPSLAPPGKHLVMCHQRTALDRLDKIDEEIELGLEDVKDLFPDKKIEILIVQVHHGRWPVNRAFSGTDFGNKTPVSNLLVVGDGAKGEGGIEIEGITFGVRDAMKLIRSMDR
ncbi:MAG: NAD(P)/FAD-dependent oxidoreductase [Methanosarcinales archaeon]|jgi:phytoene dehydrogenase-like protein|nr:NAD(P)/FAD-dependent oxidoreductase [Methanosarcinales archaeon]